MMNRFVIIALTVASQHAAAAQQTELARFFAAIRDVETGAAPHQGRDALGDDGRSLGPYQISRAYWKDSGVAGQYRDVRDPVYAERVMLAYWSRYCPVALARRDLRTLARIHNGGPAGSRKAATLPYWQRVSRRLSQSREVRP